jgi:hypothetical protein
MSRNGSGVYSAPGASFPAVAATLIESAKYNNVINDISTALTESIARDGQTTITANIPMSGFKFTGLANGVSSTDSATVGQVSTIAAVLSWCGTAGGTANALTLTPSTAISAYAAGLSYAFKSGATPNSAATTVAISGLSAIAVQNNSAALVGGEIEAGKFYEIVLDSTSTAQIRPFKFNYAAQGANTDITSLASPSIANATATTQAISDNSTKVATTAYVDRATTDRIQPITASVAANAMTITLNPTQLDFRSTTAGSGAITTAAVTAAISTVISSGSTGGTVNAIPNRLAVLAINNAGTVELAWCNAAGSVLLDENTLLTTTAEGGAGAADSANTVYSTTARTGVAFRVVGFVDSTQATAGTWATAPSSVQGVGGLSNLNKVGQIQVGATVATTSGTSIDVTGIPSWAKRVTLMLDGVSLSAAATFIVQLGDSGGIEATGYNGAASIISGSVSSALHNTGFDTGYASSGTPILHGKLVFELQSYAASTWVCTGILGNSNAASTSLISGAKALSAGPLTQLRMTTTAGTATFDAGTISVSYE